MKPMVVMKMWLPRPHDFSITLSIKVGKTKNHFSSIRKVYISYNYHVMMSVWRTDLMREGMQRSGLL